MNKKILNFREHPDQPGQYCLIVKATDLGDYQETMFYLKGLGFKVFSYPDSIEAEFTGEYMQAVNVWRTLEADGWTFRNYEKIYINGVLLDDLLK